MYTQKEKVMIIGKKLLGVVLLCAGVFQNAFATEHHKAAIQDDKLRLSRSLPGTLEKESEGTLSELLQLVKKGNLDVVWNSGTEEVVGVAHVGKEICWIIEYREQCIKSGIEETNMGSGAQSHRKGSPAKADQQTSVDWHNLPELYPVIPESEFCLKVITLPQSGRLDGC